MGNTGAPWRYRKSALLMPLLAMGLVVSLAGCDAAQRGYPTAVFKPETPQAAQINGLAIILLIIAAIAFVIVEVWLLLNAFLFRNRPEERAVQNHGNLKLETGWTIATAVVIFTVLGFTVKTMVDVTTVPDAALPQASAFPGDEVVMRVVGHQWFWSFEYPREGITTGNEIHVPVGRTVRAQLESDDVIHSFWVPRLMGKTDTIPGKINYTAFVVTQPGIYHGLCGEYCGAEHAHMGFEIIAEPVADFSQWARAMLAPPAQPTTDQQRAGQQAFQRTCSACHTIHGTPAAGKIGPNLTLFGTHHSIGADTMPNTPENLAAWIKNPQAIKPDNKMPNLNLDQATINSLVAYLENLK